jgi:hypothetical protein
MVLRDRHRAAHPDITRSDHLPPVSATLTRERAFHLASDLVNAGNRRLDVTRASPTGCAPLTSSASRIPYADVEQLGAGNRPERVQAFSESLLKLVGAQGSETTSGGTRSIYPLDAIWAAGCRDGKC